MKIKFLVSTYIRVSNTELNIRPVGVALAESTMEVDDRLYQGASIDGIDLWYRDWNGWYYWSGQVVRLESDGPVDIPTQTPVGVERINDEDPTDWEEDEDEYEEEEGGLPGGNFSGTGDDAMKVEEKNWAIDSLEIDTLYWENGLLGKGVKVALLDTGIDPNYPDLKGRIARYRDFCDLGLRDQNDIDGHGTNCAGLVGGIGQNQLLGIAPGAQLLVGRVMTHRDKPHFDHFIAGMEWAMEQAVDIIFTSANWKETSLSVQQKDQLENVVKYAAELGTLIVAASGDAATETPEDHFPACFEDVLSVGAYDTARQRVTSSIKSYTLDVLAPGGQLEIALWGPEPNKDDMLYSGFAAAIVSGLMALIYQYLREHNRKMTIAELLNLIRTTAINNTNATQYRSVEYGWGLINPKGILEALERG